VTVDEFRERLNAVKRTGSGWEARCPTHEDRKASLSITEGDGGQILLHCHAGCATESIVAELGLTMADLFPDDGQAGRPEFVATYDYVDEAGVLLFQVLRRSDKQFRQRRPDGYGGWVWKLGSARRVLYRLPEVLAAIKAGRTIDVVEGEKDVHALEAVGEVATCNPMGAGPNKWRDSYSEALRGANAMIVQDRDDKGRKHAANIAASLTGIVGSPR
jgi:putative DNA primase/helicase